MDWEVERILSSPRYTVSRRELMEQWSFDDVHDVHEVLDIQDLVDAVQADKARRQAAHNREVRR